MAWNLFTKLRDALTQQPRQEQGGEVTLTSCSLERTDPQGPGLKQGEECTLETRGESVAALGRGRVVGYVPETEAVRIAGLLRQGAGVGCRIVQQDKGAGLVRVRIYIRI